MLMQDDYKLRKDIDRVTAFANELNTLLEKYGDENISLTTLFNHFYDKSEVDGLLADYYSKEETDTKLTFNSKYLLKVAEYYNTYSENMYTLFRGDCWTINNNFEASASITSTDNANDDYPLGYVDNFTVTGTFRTDSDMIGIYWNSKDIIEHPYISYGNKSDYTDVILEFDYSMTGCVPFSNSYVSLTIRANAGEIYYIPVVRFITTSGHIKIDFDSLILRNGDSYIDRNGDTVTVNEDTPIDVTNIKNFMFVLIPTTNSTGDYTIIANQDFTCTFENITVTNGNICNEHRDLEPHQYRLCEGYDDFYNLNPKRVCREMRKLGYVEWCDLYIGASHYYEKSGTIGTTVDVSDFDHTRTEAMVLNKNVPLNKAFAKWLDCYCRELKANDTNNLIISVSMENLQPPTSWRQKDALNNYAETAWIPSTFFYSVCNSEVAPYMQSVSRACLDIVVDNDLPPILQMGEAWWWWNENYKPTDEHDQPILDEWQPPCFYDDATKTAYYNEFGESMPEYTTSWESEFNEEMMQWLNQQLCDYSDELRSVVKSNTYNGQYMALFFPPSVLDTERVPLMMQQVNYLKNAYSPDKLDVLELEDYDWVTGESEHHDDVYNLGQSLGFTEDKLHYYGGFVQYEKDALEYWRLINDAMDMAIERYIGEVFVWAGTQVRRDNKIIGHDEYELILKLTTNLNEASNNNYWIEVDSEVPHSNLFVNPFLRLANFYYEAQITFDTADEYKKLGSIKSKYRPFLETVMPFTGATVWGVVDDVTGNVYVARNTTGTTNVRTSVMWRY